MTEESGIAYKPQSFLAILEPGAGSVQRLTPHASLRFQKIVATAEYTARLHFGEHDTLTASADDQRFLLFAGEVYGQESIATGDMLLSLYERRGPAFVHDLNGVFCLLLIDRQAGLIMLATDRHNFLKLLVRWHEGTLIASNSIYLHSVDGARIDRTAVACYVAAGKYYNDLTVFENIRTLESASVYRLQRGKLDQHKYWRGVFSNSSPSTSPEMLSHELGERLVAAVRRRLRTDRPTYLSLSGGTDSRAILGVLADTLRIPDVHCFSYAHGEALPHSDEGLSSRLAALCGYQHQLVPSFDGDAVTVLRRNARLGGAMIQACDEVDAWVRLGASVGAGLMPVLYVGDTPLLKNDMAVRTVADAMSGANMPAFTRLSWLEPFIGSTQYHNFAASVQAEIDRALSRIPPTQDKLDLRDMIRFDQTASHGIGNWREYFAGRFFKVASPFYDNDMIDLMLRLPSKLRLGKQFYLSTVAQMYPRLFALPRARSASYAGYWPEAIKRQQADLMALVQGKPSLLDDVIEPDLLLVLLAANRPTLTRPNALLGRVLKTLYHRLGRANWNRTTFARPSTFTHAVSADTFLKRALILRGFLAEMQRGQRQG